MLFHSRNLDDSNMLTLEHNYRPANENILGSYTVSTSIPWSAVAQFVER